MDDATRVGGARVSRHSFIKLVGEVPSVKFVVPATWDDVPHLDEGEKKSLLASIPPYQRDARSKGVPQLGAGAIYPVVEEDITVPPFAIPDHWPRGFGFDVGWNVTAGVHIAHDRDNDIRYIYRVWRRGEAEPVVHAAGVKVPGDWIPGRVDPAARGRGQADGKRLLKIYTDLGLKIQMAPRKVVESGIYEVWTLLSTGRLKVFASMTPWFDEFRLYRRNDKGAIVKEDDHLMDATRYHVISGVDWMLTKPVDTPTEVRYVNRGRGMESGANVGWMRG